MARKSRHKHQRPARQEVTIPPNRHQVQGMTERTESERQRQLKNLSHQHSASRSPKSTHRSSRSQIPKTCWALPQKLQFRPQHKTESISTTKIRFNTRMPPLLGHGFSSPRFNEDNTVVRAKFLSQYGKIRPLSRSRSTVLEKWLSGLWVGYRVGVTPGSFDAGKTRGRVAFELRYSRVFKGSMLNIYGLLYSVKVECQAFIGTE